MVLLDQPICILYRNALRNRLYPTKASPLNLEKWSLKNRRKCKNRKKTSSYDLCGPISRDPIGFDSKFQRFLASTKVPFITKRQTKNRFFQCVTVRVDPYKKSLLKFKEFIVQSKSINQCTINQKIAFR